MKQFKYNYYKTIQQNNGYGWESVDNYESNSSGRIQDKKTRSDFQENLKAYRDNEPYPLRVVTTKEINPKHKPIEGTK